MSEENPNRKRLIVVAFVVLGVVWLIATVQNGNEAARMRSVLERDYPTPVYTMQPKPTIDSSMFKSDTRYGDYYYIRRTNIEILVNCKTGRVITRDRTTKEEADATALAKSMGVDFSTVCR